MAIYRNQAGQKLAVFAYTPADGQPTTGDASNITAYLSKDWGAAAALADTNPTELDATNMPGWYVFDLAQTETDAEVLIVAPQSATTGVVLDQVQVFTLDATISSRASQSSVDDVPTVAELNARTLPSADYFDPATDTVANVTTVRTLTQSAIVPGPTTTAGEITRRRGDSWEITLADLSLEGRTEVWFTIKRGYDYPDDAALLQITETGGLVRLNGAAAEAGDAALAITGTHDAATITVRAEATAQLPTGTFVYDLQWMDAAGDIHTVSLGTFTVSSDVTRATR